MVHACEMVILHGRVLICVVLTLICLVTEKLIAFSACEILVVWMSSSCMDALSELVEH